MLCIGIIFTILESARIQALKVQMISGAESALDSVFAEYDRNLFEKYGITLFHGGLEETLMEYLSFEYNPSKDRIHSGMSFFPLTVGEVVPERMIRVVDNKGSIFAQVVVEYMKYKAVGDQSKRILDQLNLLKKGEAARKDTEEAKEEAKSGDWDKLVSNGMVKEVQNTKIHSKQNVVRDGNERETKEGEEETFDRERFEKEWDDSVIHDVEEAKKRGVLKLVLPRGSSVSGEKMEKGELPSEHIPEGEALNYENGMDEMGRELLYNVYLTSYFPSFVSKEKRNGVQYELEYIIFGESSDDKNLKACVNRLLLIREGLNVLHIIKSPEKMKTIWSMAMALMGWTQIPMLVTLMKGALVGAWAFGESIIDVRTLLDGGKVNIIKSDSEWNLGLDEVASFLKGNMQRGKEGKNGLVYTDYLMLLLFLEKKEEKYYRTMDMVQTNMRKIEPEFQLKDCIFGVQLELEVQAGNIFSKWISLPLGKNLEGLYDYRFSVSKMY